MLSQLYIENVAVIEKAGIDFRGGLNVLTGETGAGKSIVIDAINAILGERTSRELVRSGARSAFVSAEFTGCNEQTLSKLSELGFVPEEGSVVIQREISADGKTSCKVNGRPATVSMLKELGAGLINIHGQHDSYDLLSPDLHVRYIDRMGVPEDLRTSYHGAYVRMNEIKHALEALNMDEEQKARRIDLLRYQIAELEGADLQTGEQEELNERKTLCQNAEKIATQLLQADTLMDGGEDGLGAVEAVKAAADALLTVERYLPGVHELAERMQSLTYELEDCKGDLRVFLEQMDAEPDGLEEIEERLDVIYRLGLKYGGTVEKMLTFLEDCRAELNDIELSDENAARLTAELEGATALAKRLAEQISGKRAETAARFSTLVMKELVFLNMPGITFIAEQETCALNALGCDKLQFLISTNAGEPPKPISKIASGGELSRVMLAIKTVLAGCDSVPTLIFDEVDTGVSGGAAQKVGLKLREVSHSRQVLCVTHLAQIAALGDSHFLIEKFVKDSKTYTQVSELDTEGRKRELARIIGGAEITPLTLQNAEEMLKLAAER